MIKRTFAAGRLWAGALVLAVALVGAGSTAQAAQTVAVVVNSDLQPLIQTQLDQYVADLQASGYTVVVRSWSLVNEPTPAALKTYLKGVSSIVGAVLIGDLPIQWHEIANDYNTYGYATWPIDLFYMDFTSTWSDADGNGRLDTVSPLPAPEIWVSRIKASNMAGCFPGLTEADLVNRYFTKNHAFRAGTLRQPDRAMTYIDDDWSSWTDCGLKAVYSSVTVVNDPVTTTAADFMSRWPVGHEHFLVCAHSNSQYCVFKSGTGGSVTNTQVAAGDPAVLFWNLFDCSAARYTDSNFLGGAYSLAATNGILAVGSTKTGSMLNFSYYYTPIGQQKSHGEAFKLWFQSNCSDVSWHYGMTMLGDGTLRIARFMGNPQPNQPPEAVATATPVSGLTPLTVSFSGSGSYDVDGTITNYAWNFGDGSTGNGPAVSHTYTKVGTFTVTLTVTDNAGATDSTTLTVAVSADPSKVLHVSAITMSLVAAKGGTQAKARVVIVDTAGAAKSGATVTGTWSGAVRGSASGTTGADGSVTLTSGKAKSGTFTFTVTGVSASSYTYDPTKNVVTSASIVK